MLVAHANLSHRPGRRKMKGIYGWRASANQRGRVKLNLRQGDKVEWLVEGAAVGEYLVEDIQRGGQSGSLVKLEGYDFRVCISDLRKL